MTDLTSNAVFPAEEADPRFRDFFAYWKRAAPPGLLPGRQHIDPMDIPALLPGIVLYDVVDEGGNPRFRFRLVGTMMCAVVGTDPTGRFLDEMVMADKKDEVRDAFTAVARTRCAHYWENPLWTVDRTFIRLQRLALPLARDGIHVDMIVAYYVRSAEAAPT